MNGPSNNKAFLNTFSEEELSLCYKDAICFSPHKLVGGPGSSGILLVKKNVLF